MSKVLPDAKEEFEVNHIKVFEDRGNLQFN